MKEGFFILLILNNQFFRLYYICTAILNFIMIKKIILSLFFISFFNGFSQQTLKWSGYFSFNKIVDVTEASNKIMAVSENAFFSKDITSNQLKVLNSIDGLKAETITSVYFSTATNKTFIGSKNGLLLVVNQDGSILFKNGIVEEVPVSPFIKKINHFKEDNGKIYIATDYGITVFDLATLEFGDTYYIGTNGESIKIFQTTILNGEIYATTQNNGIKKAILSNPNLVDFSQWQTFNPNFWYGVTTFNNQLVAANTNGRAYKFTADITSEFANLNGAIVDIRVSGTYLIITTATNVLVFNQALQQIAQIQNSQITEIPVTFTCATVINDLIYIGTNENGIVTAPLLNATSFQFLMPNGPLNDTIFRIKKSSRALWALYGKYNRTYNPYNPNPPYGLYQFPISKFTSQNGWTLLPYEDLLGAQSLSNIAFNPNNDRELYVSSYYSGLLKIVNDVPTNLYDATNTGSNGLEINNVADGIRVNGPVFDRNGTIWMTENFVAKGLKSLKPDGQWQSFDLSDIIPDTNVENYALLVVDRNNTKWIPTSRNGLIAYNETVSKSILIKGTTQGNLPSTDVRCLAIDNRNQLWIGTSRGLRIVSSVDQFLSQDEITTRSIIILEDNLAQELFFDQFILDITVDGANRKWVSIADSGVYLVSANGQETLYHFTKENSPLPSDNVNDIEIDAVSGEVFFATDKGLVSFTGTATKPSDDLENVYAYPNPVRPGFSGTVKIAGLTSKATVKITDIEGNLVHEATSEGGTIEWDTTALGKYKVASGVYMILVSTFDGAETTVKKVMIIR